MTVFTCNFDTISAFFSCIICAFPFLAPADYVEAFGTVEGSGKCPGPADRKPESEPCQRGSLHLETSACLSVSTARLAIYTEKT